MLVSDLPKYIKLYNFIYHIQELNSVIGDIFVNNESFNSVAFNNLEHVIVKHKYLILVIGDSALSIIFNNTSFYVFDPHKRNTYGLPDSNGGAIVLKFNSFKQLCLYIHELSKSLSSTHYELTPVIITKYKQIRSDQKANTNTSTEMKISHKVKQDTSSEKNSSQTVEIKNKTNKEKQCQKDNISNNKLERSQQKANTNNSTEMKISHNLIQNNSLEKNSLQTVEIKNKTNEDKQCQKQNISNNKLENFPLLKANHNEKIINVHRNNHKLSSNNDKTILENDNDRSINKHLNTDSYENVNIFPLYSNKRKFEQTNYTFTNKRFRNNQNNMPETMQNNLIKRKDNHQIDRSKKKQKVDSHNTSKTCGTNVNNASKLNQNKNEIKNVEVKLTEIALVHKQKNEKAYKIA